MASQSLWSYFAGLFRRVHGQFEPIRPGEGVYTAHQEAHLPGDQQLHVRIPAEKLQEYRDAAQRQKMSLTTLIITVMDQAVTKINGAEAVSASKPTRPAEVQPDVELVGGLPANWHQMSVGQRKNWKAVNRPRRY